MRRPAVAAAWSGLVAVQGLVANSYLTRGASWHWLLHVPIGLGIGLAVGALVWVLSARRVPALGAGLIGQLVSIAPDLAFRFLRMPHTSSMDLFLGHIAIHTGPSPVLVALAVLLLLASRLLALGVNAGPQAVQELLVVVGGGDVRPTRPVVLRRYAAVAPRGQAGSWRPWAAGDQPGDTAGQRQHHDEHQPHQLGQVADLRVGRGDDVQHAVDEQAELGQEQPFTGEGHAAG